jgi:tetratricopeptide (TPR) repeat protein
MAQEHPALNNLICLLTVLLLLGGCSLVSPRPSQQAMSSPNEQPNSLPPTDLPPPPSAPPPRPPPAPVRENHLSPATLSLVTQAKTQLAHGDMDGASSTLDRALRIEPNNPLLWIQRGQLRLAENDAHQAEGCGRKALSLATGDHATQRQAGRLLADALRAQQRNQEAQEIERQPFML